MLLGMITSVNKQYFFSKSLLSLPIWPQSWLNQLRRLKQHNLFAPWLTFVSQLIGLSFSLGCLVAFLLVLLFSDISFVWRSTLLNAEQVYPFLKAISWPWQFIDSAQPVKQTLIASQELRFGAELQKSVDFGSWWAFLFMAQFVYSVVPRLGSTMWTKVTLSLAIQDYHQREQAPSPLVNQIPVDIQLEPIAVGRPTLEHYNLVCWLSLNSTMTARAIAGFDQPQNIYQAGFHGDDEQAAMDDDLTQLVLVAAWEPPLGELQDFLEHGRGILMPLDFNGENWVPIEPHYLDEWRRFTQTQEHWTLFVNKELK